MKKVVFLLLLIIGVIVIANYGRKVFRSKIESALSLQPTETLLTPHPTPTAPAAKIIDETLFVPYWSVKSGFNAPSYKKLVYFGVKATEQGIDTSDPGYQQLPVFMQGVNSQNTILAVRMIDNSSNFAILKSASSQQHVIKAAIAIAKRNHFSGILLNLEVSALPFSSLVDQIVSFNTSFSQAAHESALSYGVTAYGDSFYRLRPFDISKMAKDSDTVYIMAYDFSKANGNPGPNFPLSGNDTYGYDFSHMIDNFADSVPLKKLIVIFGMYGYDWPVDNNSKATGVGTAASLVSIKNTIIDACDYLSCEWERDLTSGETKATYQDDTGKHIVWFEDEESVKRKQEFLRKRGIGSYAYWAYSYF